jgi:hypothetical protein
VHRSPDELHFFVGKTFFLVLVIDAGEHECIKAHLCEEASICITVAEGVDLPANAGALAEFFHSEFVACHHVIHHVFVVGTGFVVHGPPGVE